MSSFALTMRIICAVGDEEVAYWAVYLKEWVRMNHVRTVTPLVTAFLLILSLRA